MTESEDGGTSFRSTMPCSDLERHTGPAALTEHLGCLEWRLYYSLLGLRDEAEQLAEHAEALSKPAERIRARLLVCDVQSRMGDAAGASAELHELAVAAEPWPYLRRRSQMLLGATAERLGNRAKAMRLLREALESWPDDDRPAWRAETLMVLAMLAVSRTDVEYSLVHHAVAEVTSHCDALLLSVTLANFAEVSAECGDLAVSTEFADAAVALLRRHPDVTATLTLDSIARSRFAVGELGAAAFNLNLALDLEEKLGCSDVGGDPWLTLAEVKLALGEPDEAWQLLAHPRRVAWAAKTSWTLSRDLRLRAEILAATGEWEQAYRALTAHLDAYEQLRSVEGDRAVAESETWQLAHEERRRATEFEKLALTDPLTGLPNRRRVDRWLLDAATAAEASSRQDIPITIAIIDLDHFKRINDTYSHDTGDAVLRRVADLFRHSCPDGGNADRLVARLGGEEFVLLLFDVSADKAEHEANELLERLRERTYDDISPALRVTASIGLAIGPAIEAGPALMKVADECLYEAKRSGRNRVIVAAAATH